MYISFFKDKGNATSVRGGEILYLQEQNATAVVDRRERIRRVLQGYDEILDHFRHLAKIRVT